MTFEIVTDQEILKKGFSLRSNSSAWVAALKSGHVIRVPDEKAASSIRSGASNRKLSIQGRVQPDGSYLLRLKP